MWIVAAFISAALLGLYDVSKKHSLRGNAVIPILFLNTLLCSLFFLVPILLSAAGVLSAGDSLYVEPWCWPHQRFILLKSVIVLASWILGYYAMAELPLTIAGPLNATRPVMTLVGALLIFGEELNMWQWAGVSLAILSVFMLSRSGKREGVDFVRNKWIVCLAGAALLGAVSGLYDKFLMSVAGLGRMEVQGWYNLYQCLMMGAVFLTIWWPKRHRGPAFQWRWSIVLISVFLTCADLAYFYALTIPGAMISVVSMVRRGSVVVSFLCGALIFGEKNLRSKSVDLLLVLLGMMCLWIGS